MARKVAIYARVSTRGQTLDNQLAELRAACERNGWQVVRVFTDHGISGAKGRGARKGLDDLLKAVVRREIDQVCVWSIDRLGRSLRDLINVLDELRQKGCELYVHQTGNRHEYAIRQNAVSNAGRLRRVRARNNARAHRGGAAARSRSRQANWAEKHDRRSSAGTGRTSKIGWALSEGHWWALKRERCNRSKSARRRVKTRWVVD